MRVAIILIAVGCVTAVTRLRLADRRSVAAHHRALETMGRLVAQHPAPEPAAPPEQPPSQAHVRVVGPDEPEQVAAPDTLRPRIRGPRPPEYISWGDVAPVEPAPAADLKGDLGPPAAIAGAGGDAVALGAGPTLHFDALASAPLAAEESPSAAGQHWRPSSPVAPIRAGTGHPAQPPTVAPCGFAASRTWRRDPHHAGRRGRRRTPGEPRPPGAAPAAAAGHADDRAPRLTDDGSRRGGAGPGQQRRRLLGISSVRSRHRRPHRVGALLGRDPPERTLRAAALSRGPGCRGDQGDAQLGVGSPR